MEPKLDNTFPEFVLFSGSGIGGQAGLGPSDLCVLLRIATLLAIEGKMTQAP